MTYETGANTLQANNLVLSVMNDGVIHMDRMHCGYAMLQGVTHRMSFRDIVSAEAAKQRKQFNSKFSASHISEAAKIVQSLTLEGCLEAIENGWDRDEKIHVHGRKYWDRGPGNTYWSACITVPQINGGTRHFNVPFSYGYGDAWQWSCMKLLAKLGFINESRMPSEAPIDFAGGEYTLKRNMYAGVYLQTGA